MDRSLETLLDRISSAAQDLLQAFQVGNSPARLGLRRSARLPVAAALHRSLQMPVLLITDRFDHALAMVEELELWNPGAPTLLFPEPTPLFYENAAWGESTRRERLLSLTTLSAYHIPGASVLPTPPVVVASIRALMTRTLPRRDFLTATRTLRIGQSMQLNELVRNWLRLGYEPVTTVITPGQFARRGGILDLWPPAETYPVRLEFFGDEIDTFRYFDPSTQRTLDTTVSSPPDRVLVTPAREYLLPASVDSASSDANYQRAFLDATREIHEFDIPRLHTSPASLFDYLPSGSIVMVDDRQALEYLVTEVEEQAIKIRHEAIASQTLPEDFPVPYLSWTELNDAFIRLQAVELGPSTGSEDSGEYPETPDQPGGGSLHGSTLTPASQLARFSRRDRDLAVV